MTRFQARRAVKTISNIFSSAALALSLGACATGSDGDEGDMPGDTGGMGETGADDEVPPVTTLSQPTVTDSAGDDDADDGSADDGPDDGDTGDTGEPADTGDLPEYEFSDTPPENMDPVDRMGMPAINTAVISSKDAYNESTPADDAAGDFVAEIVASLEFLHGALDDDLTGASLVPCLVDDCVTQAAPLVVPDVLQIDPSADPGFPNGRLLADPVIDVTLAVVLLDLSAPGQTAGILAGLPLNPPENDVPFDGEFPFLAAPH